MKFKETKKAKKVRKFSLIFVPEDPMLRSTSKHFSFSKFYLIISSYSILCAFAGFLVLNLTPLKDIVFPVKEMTNSDRKMILELNGKMLNLNTELEKIRNTNLKLLRLSDTSVIKTGGNIYTVILDFFDKFVFNQNQNSSIFINPVSGHISRNFLPEKGHMGIDYVLKTGTPVHSTAAGYIIFSDYTVKDGYMIIIVHPENYMSVYKHCSSLIKKEREKVLQGELIALSGNTGEITSGPHLHLEIWKNGKPIDPLRILIKY